MNTLLLYLVIFFHIMVVCFVVLAPFSGNNCLILLHAISVPFIMAHWYLNDNTCVLSMMESRIRKHINKDDTDINNCFTCKLINPIYDFKANNENFSTLIYLITTTLWIFGLRKLYVDYKTGKLKSIYDLFEI